MESETFSIQSADNTSISQFYFLNIPCASIAFFSAYILALNSELFDIPITSFLNSVADKSYVLDRFLLSIYSNELFSGVLFISLIWSAWFKSPDITVKTRLAVGTLASWVAGMVSRALQYSIHTHPRPFYDPRLHFHAPHFIDNVPLNTWDSFPSDHVTVFAGLITMVFLTKSPTRWFAIAWAFIVEGTRTYMGAHYPSDLLGGAALGAGIVCASQTPAILRFGESLTKWERLRPSVFYPCAFVLSYEIATLFFNLRTLAAEILSLRHAL